MRLSSISAAATILCGSAAAQLSPVESWTATATTKYQVLANVTYLTASNYESKLDIYKRRDTTAPQPTLLYIHGGGWVGGTKESTNLWLLPWMEKGWTVVNVEYRLGRVAPAPAAVEDCLCALRWVASHAREHGVDVNRIVVTGGSAGGHLALTTGMIPEAAGLDRICPGPPLPKVAGIVNWYGITDVGDLLDGVNRKAYAVQWMGSQPDRMEIAKRVSPLTYVRAGLPPVITIHGDADPTVPYQHALRLDEAMKKAGTPHRLVTVPGGRHGNFKPEENLTIYTAIAEFLAENKLSAK